MWMCHMNIQCECAIWICNVNAPYEFTMWMRNVCHLRGHMNAQYRRAMDNAPCHVWVSQILCVTHQCVSRIKSCVSHMNASWAICRMQVIYECVVSRTIVWGIWISHFISVTYEWVMSYICHMNMRRVTEIMRWHVWMSHTICVTCTCVESCVSHTNESCVSHTNESCVSHMNESCHTPSGVTHEWVLS